MKQLSLYSKTAAFTLAEIAVTLAITTIGLVGLNAMMLEANRSAIDSGSRSQAVWMIEDLRNRIVANPEAALSYNTGGEQSCSSLTTTKVCADYFDGTNDTQATVCSGAELAAYDLWDTFCGRDILVSNADVVKTNASSFIADPKLSVSVTPTSTDQEFQITIALSWASRTGVATDTKGNKVYITDVNLMSPNIKIATRRDSIKMDFTP